MAGATSSPAAPPLPYSARCEQLVYTWGEQTFTSPDGGFGVVGRSEGWPPQLLTGWYSYIPMQAVQELERQPGPVTLTRANTPFGTLVTHKRPLGDDPSGRPGNYIVHALLDPSRRLGAREALALYRHPLFADGWTSRATRLLPAVDVPALPARPEPLPQELMKTVLPALLEAVLLHDRTGLQVGLELADEAEGVAALQHLAAALPPRLAARLTFSTYERQPPTDWAMVTLINRPFLELGVPVDLPLITPDRAALPPARRTEREAAVELAQTYLEGRQLSPSLAIADSLDAVRRALAYDRSAAMPVEELSADQLADIVLQDEHWTDQYLG